MNLRHFLRMARFARRPASEQQVKMVFAIIAVCLIIAGIEWLFGWPEGLKPKSLNF